MGARARRLWVVVAVGWLAGACGSGTQRPGAGSDAGPPDAPAFDAAGSVDAGQHDAPGGDAPAGLATVTTAAVSAITSTTARSGGTVTSQGGASVTARGVCFGHSQSPTIADAHTSDGDGDGAFVSNLTSLTPGTLYYVRAYATNASGTAYGDQQIFVAGPSFTVANWNLNWFGDATPGNGPADEALQQANVETVLATLGADIYGLVEVADTAAFNALVAGLPGYAGFAASDPSVTGGPTAYSLPAEQRPAFLYKTTTVQVQSAAVIPTMDSATFAWRAPLVVRARVTLNGSSGDLVVVVVHLKATIAGSEVANWQTRVASATELKTWLDADLPAEQLVVIGDWNDDLDESTVSSGGVPLASPFQVFLADPANYLFATQVLTTSHVGTYCGDPVNPIDHQLLSTGAAAHLVVGSTRVARPDQWTVPIADFSYTTSDHYPVLSSFTVGGFADGGVQDAGGGDAGCTNPAELHPNSPGPFCPFSTSPDAGPWIYCGRQTQECCQAAPDAGLSQCLPQATTCALGGPTYQCDGPQDCTGGTLCCGLGTNPVPDAYCAGTYYAGYGFNGTVCAASCGQQIWVCRSTADCPAGRTCAPFRKQFKELGMCVP
jgi:endonuclease/exonuclease/phosphatase family metal-dependent hydrolase